MAVNTVDAVGTYKFITFKLSQTMFLDYGVEEFGPVMAATDDATVMDEEITEITILARFYTEGSNGAFVEDFFEIKVTSSGETKAATCADDFASLDMETAFIAVDREYVIKKEWDSLVEKEIYVPASYTGFENLKSDCASQLYRTLDYQVDGIWKTAFTEFEEIPEYD
jgi:hypothetical protein